MFLDYKTQPGQHYYTAYTFFCLKFAKIIPGRHYISLPIVIRVSLNI